MAKKIVLTNPKNGNKVTLTRPGEAPKGYKGIDMYKLAKANKSSKKA